MPSGAGLGMGYWQRFGKHYWAGLRKSTGEQVIGVLLTIGIVLYQIHYGIIAKDQTRGAYWSIAWPYILLLSVLLIWHLIKTPAEMDANHISASESANAEIAKLNGALAESKLNHLAGRPLLGLEFFTPEGEERWQEFRCNERIPMTFALTHLGGRTPTSLRFESIQSDEGPILVFDPLPFVHNALRSPLSFTISDPNCIPLAHGALAQLGDSEAEVFWQFFVEGNRSKQENASYELIAKFRDGDTERTQVMPFEFDSNRMRFIAF